MPPVNKKPIYVSNPNDSRIKAYTDSLNNFSFNKKSLDKVLKTGKSPFGSPVDVSKKRYLTRDQDINETYNKYKALGLNVTKQDVSDESDSFDFIKGQKINKKVGSYNFPIKSGGTFRLAQYKEPEQPYIYKKEDISLLTPKKAKLSVQEPTDTLKKLSTINTITSSEAKEKVVKKSPFAQYPNMKKQLGNLETSRMVNSKKVENIVPTFVSGAKSVKQYRGDENLPEAKKGMKNCGCKHPRSKYKYGTGAIMIPENSAIVTAKNGMNKAAVDAHLRGDNEEVERIISKMPSDNKYSRKKYKKAGGVDALGLLKNVTAPSQATVNSAQYPWFKAFTSSNTEAGRTSTTGQNTLLDPSDINNQYNNIGALEKKAGRKFSSMEDLQGYIYDNMSDEQRNSMWEKFGPTLKSSEMTRENFVDKLGGARTAYGLAQSAKVIPQLPGPNTGEVVEEEKPQEEDKNKFGPRKGLDIGSSSELAYRLKQGLEKPEETPRNFLKLNRYQYVSDLPQITRDIELADKSFRETARDTVAGDAGRYLAMAAQSSASRQDQISRARARESQLAGENRNKNTDLGNTEIQTNRSLKDQYNALDAQTRANVSENNLLASQKLDSMLENSQLMRNQKFMDQQRLAMLKSAADSGNYNITTNPDGTMTYTAKKRAGAKKLKTYKRR